MVKKLSEVEIQIYNFIYDKPSADVFSSIETSLRNIPSNFDPTYGSTSAQSLLQCSWKYYK